MEFEEIEGALNKALFENNKELISTLWAALKSFDDKYINSMPENTYARYLDCLEKAKTYLTNHP